MNLNFNNDAQLFKNYRASNPNANLMIREGHVLSANLSCPVR